MKRKKEMTLEQALQVKVFFGKHKGETLAEIVESDASYIGWLAEQELDSPILYEAAGIVERAYEDEILEAQREWRQENRPNWREDF